MSGYYVGVEEDMKLANYGSTIASAQDVGLAKAAAVWLLYYKKKLNIPTVSYREAVDEALCFGWIDSKAQPSNPTSPKPTSLQPESNPNPILS